MVATLPRNIQLKLDQTLSQWHSWRCMPRLAHKPAIVRRLSRGLSNYSILVRAESLFVIRIDGLNPAVIGLSRQTEWSALQTASAAGLAPAPRYYNPELGSLVYDYLDADEGQITDPTAIATLMRHIHRLPAVHFRLDLRERIVRLEKHIEHRGNSLHPLLDACRGRIFAELETINATGQVPVLCHNDLLQANRITSDGQLLAIDWEYCAMGSPWFDLAVVTVGDALSPTETENLLIGYLDRPPQAEEMLELARHECIYRYLELLWFSALDDSVERDEQITDSRLLLLEKCLNS